MEPLWELIDEIHDNSAAPLPPLVPTLANGEPPLFEAVWRAVDSRGRARPNVPTDSKLNIVIPKPLREELFTDHGNDDERALWLKVDGGGVNRFSDFLVRVSLDFVHWHYIEVDKTLMKAWDEYKRLSKADVDMWEDDVDPLS